MRSLREPPPPPPPLSGSPGPSARKAPCASERSQHSLALAEIGSTQSSKKTISSPTQAPTPPPKAVPFPWLWFFCFLFFFKRSPTQEDLARVRSVHSEPPTGHVGGGEQFLFAPRTSEPPSPSLPSGPLNSELSTSTWREGSSPLFFLAFVFPLLS